MRSVASRWRTVVQRRSQLLSLVGERPFGRGRDQSAGHSLDFINKAFECLDLIGWEHAAAVLPTVVGRMGGGAWRRGIDRLAVSLSILLRCATRQPAYCRNCSLPAVVCSNHAALARELLGEDPVRIVDALKAAICAVARYLAAHSPTERAALQTADIAGRHSLLPRVFDS